MATIIASDDTGGERFREEHTPGPWRAGHLIDDAHSCNCRYIFGNDGRAGCVATVNVKDDREAFCDEYPTLGEAKANMRLIAAAPDMLEALKWAEAALAPFSKDPAEKSGIALIRAAILKAESQT